MTQDVEARLTGVIQEQTAEMRQLRIAQQELKVELTQYVTLVRQSLQTQRSLNEQLVKDVREHSDRIHEIEVWRSAHEASMPEKVADADHLVEIRSRLERIEVRFAQWALGASIGVWVFWKVASEMFERWFGGGK